jgi:predicted lipid-binding transport protein (Tim44 family)
MHRLVFGGIAALVLGLVGGWIFAVVMPARGSPPAAADGLPALSEARPNDSTAPERAIDREARPTETPERVATVGESEPAAAAESIPRPPTAPAPARSGSPRPRAPLILGVRH